MLERYNRGLTWDEYDEMNRRANSGFLLKWVGKKSTDGTETYLLKHRGTTVMLVFNPKSKRVETVILPPPMQPPEGE